MESFVECVASMRARNSVADIVSIQEYFLTASSLHHTQVKAFLAACTDMIKKGGEEELGDAIIQRL